MFCGSIIFAQEQNLMISARVHTRTVMIIHCNLQNIGPQTYKEMFAGGGGGGGASRVPWYRFFCNNWQVSGPMF